MVINMARGDFSSIKSSMYDVLISVDFRLTGMNVWVKGGGLPMGTLYVRSKIRLGNEYNNLPHIGQIPCEWCISGYQLWLIWPEFMHLSGLGIVENKRV